jgi:hypothetical protein
MTFTWYTYLLLGIIGAQTFMLFCSGVWLSRAWKICKDQMTLIKELTAALERRPEVIELDGSQMKQVDLNEMPVEVQAQLREGLAKALDQLRKKDH